MQNKNIIFYACLSDVTLKCPMVFMEFPFFAPTRNPPKEVKTWTDNKGKSLTVKPGIHGAPTIYDLNILIFIASQLIAAKEYGLPLSRNIKFHMNKLTVTLNRKSSGSRNHRLDDAIQRLQTSSFMSSASDNKNNNENGFALIDSYKTSTDQLSGAMLNIELQISEWLLEEILSQKIKTINENYYSLTSPFKMRLYLIFHKHLGNQKKFKIRLKKLHLKHGSKDKESKFSFKLKELKGKLLDLEILIGDDGIITAKRT